MAQREKTFLSCIESRILDNGEMYARFHLGMFFRGQALTLANALRRTLLAEIPGFIVTKVQIQGISHEFATLPGVQETVLDILLNLKKLVFTTSIPHLTFIKSTSFQTTALLKVKGPATITGADIRLPPSVKCLSPDSYIARLNSNGEITLSLQLDFVSPIQNFEVNSCPSNFMLSKENFFELHTIPHPVRKVNYLINKLDSKTGGEYIALEIWTDGSLTPLQILYFAFNQITNAFYQFAKVSKSLLFKV